MAHKKCMPLITTYKSDDSSLDDDDTSNSYATNRSNDAIDEDDQPLSRLRSLQSSQSDIPNNVTTTQSFINASFNPVLTQSNSPEYSILPNVSDSEDDSASFSSGSDEEFKELVDEFSSLPVTELLKSKRFAMIYSEKKRQKCKSGKMNTGYSQFFQEIQSSLKSEYPMSGFHDICRLVDERWSQLTKSEKKEYKRRAILAIRSQQMSSFSEYRSKLLNLVSEDNKLCCNPTCRNPVIYDPRWNGQYCSTKCVGEHCQLAFIDWCKNKRCSKKLISLSKLPIILPTMDSDLDFKPKVLSDPLHTSENIPIPSCNGLDVTASKSSFNDDNIITLSNCNTTTISHNDISSMSDSSDCLSVSLKRKPLFESLRAAQFGDKSFIVKANSISPAQTSPSSTAGATTNITLTL
ncbi:unnamed protein product [Heterobilharzia americana]|nr:unnamed protein product [Heterobilharzia americana]